MVDEPQVWNATARLFECRGEVHIPTRGQVVCMQFLSGFPGQWVTHPQFIEATGKTFTLRAVDDFLRLRTALKKKWPDTRGLESRPGLVRWNGIVKRAESVLVSNPLTRADGTYATMAEAQAFFAERYGMTQRARGTALGQQVVQMLAADGRFALMTAQPGGAVMVILAGEGWRDRNG